MGSGEMVKTLKKSFFWIVFLAFVAAILLPLALAFLALVMLAAVCFVGVWFLLRIERGKA